MAQYDHIGRLVILPIALITLLAITVFWILGRIQRQVDNRVGSSLQAVLVTTDKALQNWAEQTEIDVAVLADNDQLRTYVEAQLRVPQNREALLKSPALAGIRRVLAPAMRFYQFPSFAVISPAEIQIASELDVSVGSVDLGDNNHLVVARALRGATSLGLPFTSELFIDKQTHREYAVMTVGAPIRDEKGNVIAALALRLDPRRDFTRSARLGRLEQTGETYAFDSKGRMLTESRFESQLRSAGLIPPDAASILNLEVRDPGVNTVEGLRPTIPRDQQPFTVAASGAISGNSGMNLSGYRDYRGVQVIGAWLWDNQLGMGLVTEMDTSEAFAPYHRVRQLVITLLALMAGGGVALLFIIRHRDRLIASNTAFREALRARDDMMAMVSHDLKNPINTLVLRSHVTLQMLEEQPEAIEPVKNSLQMMRRTAGHMNQLIGDLTDVARIQAGRLDVNLLECTIEDAVEPAIERFRLLAREGGLDFTVRIAPSLPRISADPGRITQVMDNLLGNALKFTPKSGHVKVDVVKAGDAVQVSVADTGPGISAAALSRIFEPYWQVQKTRNGMGLGLFIAKTLVTAHRGKMWVESTVGSGTTFYFTLPAV